MLAKEKLFYSGCGCFPKKKSGPLVWCTCVEGLVHICAVGPAARPTQILVAATTHREKCGTCGWVPLIHRTGNSTRADCDFQNSAGASFLRVAGHGSPFKWMGSHASLNHGPHGRTGMNLAKMYLADTKLKILLGLKAYEPIATCSTAILNGPPPQINAPVLQCTTTHIVLKKNRAGAISPALGLIQNERAAVVQCAAVQNKVCYSSCITASQNNVNRHLLQFK